MCDGVRATTDLNGRWLAITFSSLRSVSFNLETAIGRARVGRDAVRWQGVTTLRAPAREAEQRSQRAAARLNRVRSALTQEVRVVWQRISVSMRPRQWKKAVNCRF